MHSKKRIFTPKRLIALAIALVIIAAVALPWPVRCYMTKEPTPAVADGGFFMGGFRTNIEAAPGTAECYSPRYLRFWNKAEGQLHYVYLLRGEELKLFFPPWVESFPPAVIHPIYAADFSDNHILMGGSHNVFVGKVLAQTGNKPLGGNPTTQFSVEVIYVVKGKIAETVTVEQEGGVKDGTLHLIEGALPALQVGSTYLFATRYNVEEGWHTLNIHPNASKLITTNTELSKEEVTIMAVGDEKVKTLEAAYVDEVLLHADIAHENTPNAFISLSGEEKSAAQIRADEAKVWLQTTTQAE